MLRSAEACFCGNPLLAESLRRLSSGDSLHRSSSSPLEVPTVPTVPVPSRCIAVTMMSKLTGDDWCTLVWILLKDPW